MTVRCLPNKDTDLKIKKMLRGRDVSHRSAFEYGSSLEIRVEAPRVLGASAAVLRILSDDTGVERDIPLEFFDSSLGYDVYRTTLDVAELCKNEKSGLFYYEFLFLRGAKTLFTDSINNVDFELCEHSANKFRLLVYEKGFESAKWFRGGVMYHVFVDRFAKGEGKVGTRDDVVIDNNWESGIPQYPKIRGESFSNNVFFGGNLWGVAEKLDYLKSLGVTVIYLSPIVKAYSNHKYDTGNYMCVDEMFGGEEAFENLLKRADEHGIKIILDGVFNHTGDDSLYFDRYGKYGKTGAYTNPESAFRNWFHFKSYPKEYESWWGIEILPKLQLNNKECAEYFVGEGGVIEKYSKMGIGGWRLDVADELPNEFLEKLRRTAKAVCPTDPIIIGEVWENAADKISYSKRRRYLRGAQLDSVMNYPLRNGILSFVKNGDSEMLSDILKEIYSSYPEGVCHSLMNILGTHDTERILTVLGDSEEDELRVMDMSQDEVACRKLLGEAYTLAKKKLLVAAAIQYTVYGVPSVYYGDEAGSEGYHDPFCRKPYPWGREDVEIRDFYTLLGKIRKANKVFANGDFKVVCVSDGFIAYERSNANGKITVLANVSDNTVEYAVENAGTELISSKQYSGKVEPLSVKIVRSAK